MSAEEDRADIARVRAGEVDAFEGIVRRWQGPLVNLAWRFCHDRGRAEEWAQEAFLKVFRELDKFRGDAAFSSWLFTVALNLYRSQLRRAVPPQIDLERAGPLTEPRPGPESLFDEDEARAVRRAVTVLPAHYRDALVLFYFHEMNVEDAARTLGVPVGTVKARLSRGRELLKRSLRGLASPRPAYETGRA